MKKIVLLFVLAAAVNAQIGQVFKDSLKGYGATINVPNLAYGSASTHLSTTRFPENITAAYNLTDFPMEVALNAERVGFFFQRGKPFRIRRGGGYVMYSLGYGWYNTYSQEYELSIFVCTGGIGKNRLEIYPPDWAQDPDFIGSDFVLTGAYLDSRPSVPELKSRVKKIADRLEGKEKGSEKMLGWKEKRKAIRDWFAAVEKHQITAGHEVCENPVAISTKYVEWLPTVWSGYGQARIFYVTGNLREGFRLADRAGNPY